jgi:DNA-binding phage protein
VPRPTREPSPSSAIETLRADAVTQLDLVAQSAATLRVQLRGFEAAIRKVRRYVVAGSAAADMHDIVDMAAVREAVTRAATDFESARHAARLAVFRVQAAEGMSLGAIARDWGISRQLVSRTLKEAPEPVAIDPISRTGQGRPTSDGAADR